MSRYFLLFIISSFIISSEISNIQVSQRQDGSGIVDICYDLIEDEGIYGSFEVNLEISFDGGETYSLISSANLYGDAGDNVIPGNGLCMQYQAPSELFTPQAKVKIIASSSFVSSQLPFSMVNIVSNSNNQSNSYEGEIIDYDYEMMQFELTNVDLVTFLETYSFELSAWTDWSGVEYDAEPIYDCNNFVEYFNPNPDQAAGTIYGCMNPDALNYNPNATESPNDGIDDPCLYEDDGTCTDSQAMNYNWEDDADNTQFDNCSCAYEPVVTDTGQDGECSWNDWAGIWLPDPDGDGGGGENGFDSDEFWEDWATNFVNGNSNFSNIYSFSGCSDPSAINYSDILSNFLNDIQYSGLSVDNLEECMIINNLSCVYECEYDFGNNSGENNVNINTFETHDISRQGNSFLIAEGRANYPIILNSQSCVDGVVAKLFMDYYGLRIPTAGEWKKAAREDNTRCWPWLEGTCESAGFAYCADFYSFPEEFNTTDVWGSTSITTEEELNMCIQSTGGYCVDLCYTQHGSCVTDCYQELGDCLSNTTDPNCDNSSGGYSDECECANPMSQCENLCDYNEGLCLSSCGSSPLSQGDCEGFYNFYQECAIATEDGDCNEITVSSGDSEYSGLEWFQGGPAEMYYDNPWFIGGGGLNDIPAHEYFTHSLFYDRFSLADCFGEYDCGYYSENGNTSFGFLNITSVGQYPMGQSSLGLYDMIGNAPEAVMYIGDPTSPPTLYTLNYRPEEDMLKSFCASDALQWSSYEHPSARLIEDEEISDYFQYYGLRLARTLAQ